MRVLGRENARRRMTFHAVGREEIAGEEKNCDLISFDASSIYIRKRVMKIIVSLDYISSIYDLRAAREQFSYATERSITPGE